MKIKRKEIVELLKVLNQLREIRGTKFAYCIARNLTILKPTFEAIQAATKPSDEFLECDQKRIEICKKHAVMKSAGQCLLVNNSFVFKDPATAEAEIQAFIKENQAIFDKHAESMAANEPFMEEEEDIDFFRMKACDLPEGLTATELTFLCRVEIIQE